MLFSNGPELWEDNIYRSCWDCKASCHSFQKGRKTNQSSAWFSKENCIANNRWHGKLQISCNRTTSRVNRLVTFACSVFSKFFREIIFPVVNSLFLMTRFWSFISISIVIAASGHYVGHLFHAPTNTWYVANDSAPITTLTSQVDERIDVERSSLFLFCRDENATADELMTWILKIQIFCMHLLFLCSILTLPWLISITGWAMLWILEAWLSKDFFPFRSRVCFTHVHLTLNMQPIRKRGTSLGYHPFLDQTDILYLKFKNNLGIDNLLY